MRAAFQKTVLVVDEGSLASTVQTRNLLRIARELRLPRVVLVGDGKQLDAVDAGKPFVQLQQAGMKTATMDQIMRQKDAELKAAVEASLKGDIKKSVRETRIECGRGQTRQSPRRRRRALAETFTAGTGKHRTHGAESRAAPADQ